jgi:hypothetical protein
VPGSRAVINLRVSISLSHRDFVVDAHRHPHALIWGGFDIEVRFCILAESLDNERTDFSWNWPHHPFGKASAIICDDADNSKNEGRFPLSIDDKPKIERVIELVRDKLSSMSPGDLRAAASVLLALERERSKN